ncbi:hypothetical protein GGQ64_002586 [Rhizobium azooxidifex]|uniref:Uncharacterized protein n=1 Tax=Mycoplana azooxidifex TaxID=1636188 RepID=A0A7W6D5Z0_9HYPH|nr:hypothetical protein [Mycoplana azooxidifex]
MSSTKHVDFRICDIWIIQSMLKRANYLTANLRPLQGPLFCRSSEVLGRFLRAA